MGPSSANASVGKGGQRDRSDSSRPGGGAAGHLIRSRQGTGQPVRRTSVTPACWEESCARPALEGRPGSCCCGRSLAAGPSFQAPPTLPMRFLCELVHE